MCYFQPTTGAKRRRERMGMDGMMVDTIRHMFIPSIPYVIPYVTSSSKTIGMILPMFRATKGLSLMLTKLRGTLNGANDVPKALPSEGLNGGSPFPAHEQCETQPC